MNGVVASSSADEITVSCPDPANVQNAFFYFPDTTSPFLICPRSVHQTEAMDDDGCLAGNIEFESLLLLHSLPPPCPQPEWFMQSFDP
jgi:hypothetical protein